jgi:uncharacterized membrane protein
MDQTVQRFSGHVLETPGVRALGAGRPFLWLRRGLDDLRRTPAASLGYGAIFAAIGALLLALAWHRAHVAPALATGFMLIAPFLAIVLYDLSRQLEGGGAPNSVHALYSWRRNPGSISLFGLLLALTLIFWERVSAIVFALFYGGRVPDLDNLFADVVLSGHYTTLLVAYFGVGGVLALAVFAASVVSLPMLLDRPVDIATAIGTSLRCVARNPAAMLVWAVIIATLMAIGFATWMVGLVLVFPWLGHASWHAYRDLVE